MSTKFTTSIVGYVAHVLKLVRDHEMGTSFLSSVVNKNWCIKYGVDKKTEKLIHCMW